LWKLKENVDAFIQVRYNFVKLIVSFPGGVGRRRLAEMEWPQVESPLRFPRLNVARISC
jgi:hypothetical protein